MKNCTRIILVISLLLCLLACTQKTDNVYVEKDGTKYEVTQQVSFYYPKDFSMDASSTDTNAISFIKDQEVIIYSMIPDDTDNKVEDMPDLYEGQLEEDGATDVGYKNVEVDSGLICQEFTGVFESNGIKFKDVVYFRQDAAFVLRYKAPEKVYNENIENISKFLNSIIVHE